MKKYYIIATCTLLMMWGCNSKKDSLHDDDNRTANNILSTDNDHDHHDGDEIILMPEEAKKMGVETEKVELRSFHQVIKTSGQIVSAQGDERTVVATVSGVVSFAKAGANEGKAVKRGEGLFHLSSSHLADGDPTMKVKNTYEAAKRDHDRAEVLIVDKLISQKEYNDIKLAYDNARISFQAIAGSGAKGASVSCPIDGFIKSNLVTEGQYVNVGDPLMVVTQNNKLQLRADVSERYYNVLQTIKSANFKTPYDDIVYKLSDMNGQLVSYGKSADGSGFYIPVNFTFNNIGNIIQGSFVEVYLISGTRDNVISVPTPSLIDEQGLYFVYCKVDAEGYIRREVRVGATDGNRVEILSGLKVGDNVVIQGAFHVKLASASSAIPHGHEH